MVREAEPDHETRPLPERGSSGETFS